MTVMVLGSESMTTTDVARYLRFTPATIARWMKAGVMPGHKRNGRWYVRRDELDAYLETCARP